MSESSAGPSAGPRIRRATLAFRMAGLVGVFPEDLLDIMRQGSPGNAEVGLVGGAGVAPEAGGAWVGGGCSAKFTARSIARRFGVGRGRIRGAYLGDVDGTSGGGRGKEDVLVSISELMPEGLGTAGETTPLIIGKARTGPGRGFRDVDMMDHSGNPVGVIISRWKVAECFFKNSFLKIFSKAIIGTRIKGIGILFLCRFWLRAARFNTPLIRGF